MTIDVYILDDLGVEAGEEPIEVVENLEGPIGPAGPPGPATAPDILDGGNF
ncbi:hypothetical protein [Phenylobacterium sp.]|uniref:hypothetical protein n=1 Tax=Phenylobacterium sp. TaxID=1871053 RepID=UPI0035B4875B